MHELPNLSYDYNALEPYIDAETMEIHHSKHHKAYVDKLNTALLGNDNLEKMSLDDLMKNLALVPDDTRSAVRNNGGGHFNHSFFWQILTPNSSGAPTGELALEINKTWGSFEKFQELFEAEGLGLFGSGWVWLAKVGGALKICKTSNQDNPLMGVEVSGTTGTPILGLDVWEHAYYLKYQNKRADYMKNWWNVVNWQKAEQLFNS